MATNYSSPTANLFDLLKPEEAKKATKQPAKQQPGKRLTPEEKSRAEAERQRQANEAKKMEAALVNQHEEEARAEGFFLNAPSTSAKATKTGHLSRAEWEAMKAKGEPLSAPVTQPEQPARNNQGRGGNRNFDGPSEVKEQRQPRGERNFERQGGDHQERRGPKPGREQDRHSQAQTGRKYNEKRGGGGKFNLGHATEPVAETVEAPVEEVEKTDAVASEPAATGTTAAVSTAVDAKPVEVEDPEDEGYGKKTLSEYEKQRAAEAEALAKLVGTIQKRTETENKIDLSKCIEADKHDDKYSKHAKSHAKSNTSAKPKAKIIEFNELLKQEGITNPQGNQQRFRGPRPGDSKVPRGRNQFPSLGEEPQPRSTSNYHAEQHQSGDNGSHAASNAKSNYQGQRPNRPPRQQGQGVQQGQGSQQPQGQRTQGPRGGQGQGQRQQGNRQQGQGQGQSRGNQGQGQRSQGAGAF